MTARAEGTFTVASWDEQTYQDLDGKGKLTRAKVGYRLSGDIEGEATLRGSGTSVATSTPPGTFTFDYELD